MKEYDNAVTIEEAYRPMMKLLPTSKSFGILTDVGSIYVDIVKDGFDKFNPVKVRWGDRRCKYYVEFGLPENASRTYKRYFVNRVIAIIILMDAAVKSSVPYDAITEGHIRALQRKLIDETGSPIDSYAASNEFVKMYYSKQAMKDTVCLEMAEKFFSAYEDDIQRISKDAMLAGMDKLISKALRNGETSVTVAYKDYTIFKTGLLKRLGC